MISNIFLKLKNERQDTCGQTRQVNQHTTIYSRFVLVMIV